MAGGNLLLLSHGYLGDLARRPALRGKHGPTPGSGIGAEILARVFPATRGGCRANPGFRLTGVREVGVASE
ncbi:MAG: hypothetical protein WB557_31350, partial [Solirubrobacteraceae bacterium]